MMPSAVADSPLVLAADATDLLDAITAEPAAPLALGVTGPGGHGRTTYLQEVATRYARAVSPCTPRCRPPTTRTPPTRCC